MVDRTSDYSINQLPENICNLFINEAKYLFHDIKNNKLKVVLVLAPKLHFIYHKIRIAVSYNPKWYRELYWEFNLFRRDRSEKSLFRISKNIDKPFSDTNIGAVKSKYFYDKVYRELIYDRLINGPCIENVVREYFGQKSLDEEMIFQIYEKNCR